MGCVNDCIEDVCTSVIHTSMHTYVATYILFCYNIYMNAYAFYSENSQTQSVSHNLDQMRREVEQIFNQRYGMEPLLLYYYCIKITIYQCLF